MAERMTSRLEVRVNFLSKIQDSSLHKWPVIVTPLVAALQEIRWAHPLRTLPQEIPLLHTKPTSAGDLVVVSFLA